jgi:HEAT repeat protein
MVIIGVAMLEEVAMRRRHGKVYEDYCRRTPFLVPLPRPVRRLVALPCRVLFGKPAPERRREVAAVVSLYTGLLIGASVYFYGGGWTATVNALTPVQRQESRRDDLARRIRAEPTSRAAYFLIARLAREGEAAVDHLVQLLRDEHPVVRGLAAEMLEDRPSPRAVPALIAALADSSVDVRRRAMSALAKVSGTEAVDPIAPLLTDSDRGVRMAAVRWLSELGASQAVDTAMACAGAPEWWVRISCVSALGALRAERALPAILARLDDEEAQVRQAAVVALYRIGSPTAREGLRRATHDPDWEVQVYASEALRRLP